VSEIRDRPFEERLAGLVNAREARVLAGGLKGIEKEALRVRPDGQLAATPHPRPLGSALTNRYITTDYSESLIELVTPTFDETWALMQFLCELHQFVYRHLGEELLWATSMPCEIERDEDVPIADYGRSNIGTMKTVYRRGLGWRYGRMMQAISGVHFNYSFPERLWPALAELQGRRVVDADFASDAYFGLLRNYRRYGWLVLYLFGASPAVGASFAAGRSHALERRPDGTLFAPYATSLRMSDLGYRNKSQRGVEVSVNNLTEYVRDLTGAITTKHPDYEAIGVKVDGEYRQLNANLLQIENEYYSFIRPKRVARSGERPTVALERAGVEYVELRALDVSAFDPVGVNQNTLRFLEAFLALCVLKDSPPIDAAEQGALDHNHADVAFRGRDPRLALNRSGRPISFRAWALELVDSMRGICELLDEGAATRPYTAALEAQTRKILDPDATPSALVMRELDEYAETFTQFALRMSRTHKEYLLDLYPPETPHAREFTDEAAASIARQQAIEAADTLSFDGFLAAYFAR
jgi:glutamate--cysteine ligase